MGYGYSLRFIAALGRLGGKDGLRIERPGLRDWRRLLALAFAHLKGLADTYHRLDSLGIGFALAVRITPNDPALDVRTWTREIAGKNTKQTSYYVLSAP